MAKKSGVELNSKEIARLLKGQEVRDMLEGMASTVAGNAGKGYGHDTKLTRGRYIASAFTDSKKAAQSCRENNTLLKALHV